MTPPDLSSWLAAPGISVWDVVFAAVSLVVAWIASIFAKRGVIALGQRVSGLSAGATILIARLVRYTIILTGVGIALVFLGASIQPLIAIALIVAAVLFLALRGVSANFAAGVILQTRHPVNVGDDIEFDGFHGVVQELNGRTVVLLARDGRTVHIPNAMLLESPIVNFSTSGRRRSEVRIRATITRLDVEQVRRTILDAASSVAAVHETPAPRLLTTSREPARLGLTMQFWHAPIGTAPTLDAVVTAVYDRLSADGVTAVVTSEDPDAALVPPPVI